MVISILNCELVEEEVSEEETQAKCFYYLLSGSVAPTPPRF